MTNFEFVDNLPGRKTGRRGELADFAAALKANAGKWAKSPRIYGNDKSAYSAASGINSGKSTDLSEGFEARARKDKEDGKVYVYVRYVGNTAPAETPQAQPQSEPVVAAQTDAPSVSYDFPAEQPQYS